jgi:hypothetical protein
MNLAEHIGAIIMDEVEGKMLQESASYRYSYDTLLRHLKNVLKSLGSRTELFVYLLCSYPDRVKAISAANGNILVFQFMYISSI